MPETKTPRERPEDGWRMGRAAFLGTVAAGIGGVILAPRISGSLGSVTGFLPNDGWRIYSVSSPMPRFDPATYQLSISGLVGRRQTLSWTDVAGLPGEEQVSDFHCVTGWSVRGVRWEGIRPKTILDLARPAARARYLTVFSLEAPYADQISLEQFAASDVMIARRMDGRPLSREHGSPLRLVIPRMYGYKGVKWVSALRFDAYPGLGFWEQRGYDVDAWVGGSNGRST